MSRFKSGFLDGSMDLLSVIEYIYIHTEDIEKLETMTPEEFKKAVTVFKYQLTPEDVQMLTEAINRDTKDVEDAAFRVEEDKKKPEETGRTTTRKLFGRWPRKRDTP